MTTEIFMTPRLIGPRFDGPAIPLDVLKDLAVLQEMIIEVAKWRFLQENQGRTRSPRGFADGVELKLTAMESGSAKPIISLVLASSMLFPPTKVYLGQARDAVVSAIGAVGDGTNPRDFLPENALEYFDRFGRSLREDEAIEFPREGQPSPARLTTVTRRKLVLASAAQELTESALVYGLIPEADQSRMTFELQQFNGSKVQSPLPAQHLVTIIEAFNGYKNGKGARVLLQGIGRYSRNGRLAGFESIEHISVLDAQDIQCRLEEFRELQDGWLDGKGKAISSDGLDWLSRSFGQHFPGELPLPFLYPTAEGGVQAEWSIANHEVTIEIDLGSFKATWHSLSMVDGVVDAHDLDMNSSADWEWAVQKLRDLAGATV